MSDSGRQIGYCKHGYERGQCPECLRTVNTKLRLACKRWMAAMDEWLATGESLGPEESKSIYEQAKAAIEAAERIGA